MNIALRNTFGPGFQNFAGLSATFRKYSKQFAINSTVRHQFLFGFKLQLFATVIQQAVYNLGAIVI